MQNINEEYSSEEIARKIVDAAISKKALNPVIIDVRGKASYADFIVICSGKNDRHVSAIANAIDLEMAPIRTLVGNEGLAEGQWCLLDYGDVIAHVFYGPKRKNYDLETLWNDVPRLPFDIPEELRAEIEYDGDDYEELG